MDLTDEFTVLRELGDRLDNIASIRTRIPEQLAELELVSTNAENLTLRHSSLCFEFEVGIADHTQGDQHDTEVDNVATIPAVVAADQVDKGNQIILAPRRMACLHALPELGDDCAQ